MTNEREEFENWAVSVGITSEQYQDDLYPTWQAATAASDARYQACIKELEDALKVALAVMECDAILIEGEWGSGRSLKEQEIAGELAEVLQVRKALSTTTPDTALQKALLGARMDEHNQPHNQRRYDELRAQLAALGE